VDGLGYFLGGTLQNVIGGTTNVNWIYTPPEGDPCGNGIVDAGEECDDGNAVDGDGCSADCILEPDSDGDGVADFADNCPDDSNEDQEDRDGDEIGDVCDPFPDEPDNDQAQCEADLTQALADLDQCLIDPPLADEDGDGEADATDQCPATVEFAEVDAAGCSQDQFCDQFGAGTIWQIVRCVFSDWGNDEPTRRVPRDCRVSWWPRSCVSW
jgi:cysteine-rich repeat protein